MKLGKCYYLRYSDRVNGPSLLWFATIKELQQWIREHKQEFKHPECYQILQEGGIASVLL
jgi:hypothetical protein